MILSLEEVQEKSGLSFALSISEYLGGLMDFTGEVGRFAIRSACGGKLAKPQVELCVASVTVVYNGVQELPYLPGKLGKKMSALKNTLNKMETVLYELSLLSDGVKMRPPGGDEDDAGLSSL